MQAKLMHSLLVVFALGISTAGCGARLADMTPAYRSSRLELERARLSRQGDPVDRTKTYISISHILLTFASDAIRDGDHAALKQSVDQYTVVLKAAGETMVNSDRNAVRRAGGYKELEIALRGQLRLLGDLGNRLNFDERGPIEDAITNATAVRDEILSLLFPTST